MRGNSIGEFIDDILSTGGPEKEFTFRDRYYILETRYDSREGLLDLHIDAYDNSVPKNKVYLCSYSYKGTDLAECVRHFENAKIFEGLTIYQAEQDIEVLFG